MGDNLRAPGGSLGDSVLAIRRHWGKADPVLLAERPPVANSTSGHFRPKQVGAAEYWGGLSAELRPHFALPRRSKFEPGNRCHDVNAHRPDADWEEYTPAR